MLKKKSICDNSPLTAERKQEVRKTNHDRNLLACKIGEGYCDDTLLSPAEAKEVAAAAQRRNVLACEAGQVSCDRSLLNAVKASLNNGKPAL